MTLPEIIADATAPDALNPLFARLHARSKDSPAKTWWHAEALHPAIFRALRMDRSEAGAIFAAMPFRLHRTETSATILYAYPTPRILAPHDDDDWLGIETVIAWNPRTDTAQIADDPGPFLLTPRLHGLDRLDVHASPFAYFRAIAEARAAWLTAWQRIESNWRQRPAEPRDYAPAALLSGPPGNVRWPTPTLPETLRCHGVDPREVNRALLRQSRIPRAHAATSTLRKAAA